MCASRRCCLDGASGASGEEQLGEARELGGELAAIGMQAIEVYHSDHSPENVAYYQSLAERYRTGVTAVRISTAANKPIISLGTGMRNNLAVPDAVLTALRELACGANQA